MSIVFLSFSCKTNNVKSTFPANTKYTLRNIQLHRQLCVCVECNVIFTRPARNAAGLETISFVHVDTF